MTDNTQLLNNFIDANLGAEKTEEKYEWDFKVHNKNKSAYQKQHPAFYQLCQNDEEVKVRLRQALAWTKFMLGIYAKPDQINDVRSFFSRSRTHSVLYYTLFRGFLDTQLYGAERRDHPGRIGIPQSICETRMLETENKKIQTVKAIISEAVELGLVNIQRYPNDGRVNVLWLPPTSTDYYLTEILEAFDQNAASVGLPVSRRELCEAKEANPNFDQDVRSKIETAIKADKITLKKY
jgi:hypothetical protein